MSQDKSTSDEVTSQSDTLSDNGLIRVGMLRIPRDQLFPILLAVVLLGTGAGVIAVTTDSFRLLGLVVLVVGLGWAILIYQNLQNRRKDLSQTDSRSHYNLTVIVLSDQGLPVKGAKVTIIGPVGFTNQATDKNGRVLYSYTGDDVINFRNREITITASYNGLSASLKTELRNQAGQLIELPLSVGVTKIYNVGGHRQSLSEPAVSIVDTRTFASMTPQLFQRVVQAVVPHVANEGNRSALISRSFFGSHVKNMIDLHGNAADFTANLVNVLHANGGVEMIITLLTVLRSDVGTVKQQELDTLLNELRAEKN